MARLQIEVRSRSSPCTMIRARSAISRGTAWTEFTFADFNIDQPRVSIVLSVADTIRLEYDFRLLQQR